MRGMASAAGGAIRISGPDHAYSSPAMEIVLATLVVVALLAGCSARELERSVYHALAKTCENQEPAERSCGF